MTEAARESMTSDASQTSSLAWQQEDARSLQYNFYPVNLVFELIFFLIFGKSCTSQSKPDV